MKIFKKVVVSALSICVMVIMSASVNALADDSSEKEFDKFCYEEDILEAWGMTSPREQKDYAGVYVDEETVVLCFKEETESLYEAIAQNEYNDHELVNQDKKLKQKINIQSAKHSYNEIMTLYDYLVENAYSVEGVYSLGTDFKGNCIEVGVLWDASISKVKKALFKMILENTDVSEISDDILVFHNVNEEDLITYKISVDGNSTLNTGSMYYSAAVGHYSSTYGLGFITTGHGPSVGDPVKIGLITVGNVMEVNHNGIDDSAFVAFSGNPGTHWWTSITTQNEAKASVSPAQGVTIRVRGFLTAPYANAVITSNNYSYYNSQDNLNWSNLLKVDYGVQNGDSGGAAYWWTTDQNATTKVIGVISAGNLSFTVIVKSSNINY